MHPQSPKSFTSDSNIPTGLALEQRQDTTAKVRQITLSPPSFFLPFLAYGISYPTIPLYIMLLLAGRFFCCLAPPALPVPGAVERLQSLRPSVM